MYMWTYICVWDMHTYSWACLNHILGPLVQSLHSDLSSLLRHGEACDSDFCKRREGVGYSCHLPFVIIIIFENEATGCQYATKHPPGMCAEGVVQNHWMLTNPIAFSLKTCIAAASDLWPESFTVSLGGLAYASEGFLPLCKTRRPPSGATCAESILIFGQSTSSPGGPMYKKQRTATLGACQCIRRIFPTVQDKEVPICAESILIFGQSTSPPRRGRWITYNCHPRGLAHATEDIFPPCKARSPQSQATCAGSILICGQSTPSPEGANGTDWVTDRTVPKRGLAHAPKEVFQHARQGGQTWGQTRKYTGLWPEYSPPTPSMFDGGISSSPHPRTSPGLRGPRPLPSPPRHSLSVKSAPYFTKSISGRRGTTSTSRRRGLPVCGW